MEAIKDKIKFNRYPAYKESGLKWLGEIPKHWELTRLGTRFEERRTKVSDKDFPPLSVTKNGILPQLDSAAKTNDGDNRKLVKAGDFVINSRSDRRGSSGIAITDGSVSLINIVMEPKDIHPAYCNYLLKCYNFIEEYYRMGHGIVADLWTTRYYEMKAIMVGIPSKDEQTSIASFLDRKTTQIDQAISQKVTMIELLKERQQILIQNAVTKGLDPNVKMKNSGVDWIGEIPEHWEVKRLKNFIKDLVSGVSVNASESESAENGELGVLKTSCVYRYVFEHFENKKVFQSDLRRVSCPVKANSIIISRMNAPELVGASGYVAVDYPNLFLPDRLWQTVFYAEENMNVYWLSKVLITRGFRNCITAIANGSSPSMKNISKGEFLNLKIAVPPIDEQDQIVSAIETNSSKIATAISLKEQEIEKLKEYKATLINSAVTGKIKVS